MEKETFIKLFKLMTLEEQARVMEELNKVSKNKIVK